jgi:hypothetical protein
MRRLIRRRIGEEEDGSVVDSGDNSEEEESESDEASDASDASDVSDPLAQVKVCDFCGILYLNLLLTFRMARW